MINNPGVKNSMIMAAAATYSKKENVRLTISNYRKHVPGIIKLLEKYNYNYDRSDIEGILRYLVVRDRI